MYGMYRNRKTEGGGNMKWWDKVLDKLIEPKPQKRIEVKITQAELLRLIEEAEREQLEGKRECVKR